MVEQEIRYGESFRPESYEKASLYLQHLNAIELLTYLKVTTCSNVLDLGCGTGLFTSEIAGKFCPGGVVLGLDISPEMIDFAVRKRGGLPNLSFAIADVRDSSTLPDDALKVLRSVRFDFVFSNYVFHWFDFKIDFPRVMAFVGSLLRPSGRVAFRFSSDRTFSELFDMACKLAHEKPWRAFFPRGFEHPQLPTKFTVSETMAGISDWQFKVTESTAFRRFTRSNELASWIHASIRPAIEPICLLDPSMGESFAVTLANRYFNSADALGLCLGDSGVALRDRAIQLVGDMSAATASMRTGGRGLSITG
jgi:trans-aconitate methyltransferase